MMKKVTFVLLSIILVFNLKVNAADQKASVHFINTGQSDCILIRSSDKNYLIDTGDFGTSDKVLKYLDELKIDKIENIIITHYHGDHYGGLNAILSKKAVNKVLIPMNAHVMRDIIYKDLEERDINIEYIVPNLKVSYRDMVLQFISPVKEDNFITNNNSIVIIGEIDGVKYAFMADAEVPEESGLIKENMLYSCDVLKVPHHGLDTSTSDNLLKTIKPKVAVITSNGLESPSKCIIDRLSKYKIPVFRTDINGDIVINNYNNKDASIEVNLGLQDTGDTEER